MSPAGDDLPPLPADAPAPGRYRHYKGNEYELVGHVRHSETLEWLVLYRPLAAPDPLWVRPLGMWSEPVDTPAGSVPRFAPLG